MKPMPDLHPLAGVYTAAVTPLKTDSSLDLEAVPVLLRFLASRGNHGALLFGTTGEGPSFSPAEREQLLRSARVFRQQVPGFRLLAGTGTPSLGETIDLTRLAFSLGFNGVVILPPYYFRKVNDDGLFEWFSEVIRRAVPSQGYALGYHIPSVTGVGFSLDLLKRLKDAFPRQFAGIKDSSHDADLARSLGAHFGNEMLVLNGTDSYLQLAMENKAQGCITAAANLISPDLRAVWDAIQAGNDPTEIQARVTAQRHVLEKYQPFAPTLKALMRRLHNLPRWNVRLPLMPLPAQIEEQALEEFSAVESAS
jgi:4-hydroxy-tetrahydrodipicolinate synthase